MRSKVLLFPLILFTTALIPIENNYNWQLVNSPPPIPIICLPPLPIEKEPQIQITKPQAGEVIFAHNNYKIEIKTAGLPIGTRTRLTLFVQGDNQGQPIGEFSNSYANQDFAALTNGSIGSANYVFNWQIPLIKVYWNVPVFIKAEAVGNNGVIYASAQTAPLVYLGKYDRVVLPKKPSQKFYMYEGNTLVNSGPCSGSAGYGDEIGINFAGNILPVAMFRGTTPMYNWVRINPCNTPINAKRVWNGIHQTVAAESGLGRAASHGCTRLSKKLAKTHHDWTYIGMPIFLYRDDADWPGWLEQYRQLVLSQ